MAALFEHKELYQKFNHVANIMVKSLLTWGDSRYPLEISKQPYMNLDLAFDMYLGRLVCCKYFFKKTEIKKMINLSSEAHFIILKYLKLYSEIYKVSEKSELIIALKHLLKISDSITWIMIEILDDTDLESIKYLILFRSKTEFNFFDIGNQIGNTRYGYERRFLIHTYFNLYDGNVDHNSMHIRCEFNPLDQKECLEGFLFPFPIDVDINRYKSKTILTNYFDSNDVRFNLDPWNQMFFLNNFIWDRTIEISSYVNNRYKYESEFIRPPKEIKFEIGVTIEDSNTLDQILVPNKKINSGSICKIKQEIIKNPKDLKILNMIRFYWSDNVLDKVLGALKNIQTIPIVQEKKIDYASRNCSSLNRAFHSLHMTKNFVNLPNTSLNTKEFIKVEYLKNKNNNLFPVSGNFDESFRSILIQQIKEELIKKKVNPNIKYYSDLDFRYKTFLKIKSEYDNKIGLTEKEILEKEIRLDFIMDFIKTHTGFPIFFTESIIEKVCFPVEYYGFIYEETNTYILVQNCEQEYLMFELVF